MAQRQVRARAIGITGGMGKLGYGVNESGSDACLDHRNSWPSAALIAGARVAIAGMQIAVFGLRDSLHNLVFERHTLRVVSPQATVPPYQPWRRL